MMMKNVILVLVICFAAGVAIAQDKKVKIIRLEVDGKPVEAAFKVDIIDGETGKVLKAKTAGDGFILPAEVVGRTVGVLVKFKKYVATFFLVSPPRFEVDWIVGVDTPPFAREYLEDADPTDTEVIYYIRAEGEPRPIVSTKIKKPKVTIRRMTDD
jgi:hypothetical protein